VRSLSSPSLPTQCGDVLPVKIDGVCDLFPSLVSSPYHLISSPYHLISSPSSLSRLPHRYLTSLVAISSLFPLLPLSLSLPPVTIYQANPLAHLPQEGSRSLYSLECERPWILLTLSDEFNQHVNLTLISRGSEKHRRCRGCGTFAGDVGCCRYSHVAKLE